MRRRRRTSELYQVDFMAALFGAFLLIWLARESGPRAELPPPVLWLDGALHSTAESVGSGGASLEVVENLMPEGAMALGCAAKETVALLATPQLRSCDDGSSPIVDQILYPLAHFTAEDIGGCLEGKGTGCVATNPDVHAAVVSNPSAFVQVRAMTFLNEARNPVDLAFDGYATEGPLRTPRAVAYGQEEPPSFVQLAMVGTAAIIVPCSTIFGMPLDEKTVCRMVDPKSKTPADVQIELHLHSRKWHDRCLPAGTTAGTLSSGPVKLVAC